MIIYIADRDLNVLGMASTRLFNSVEDNLVVTNDSYIEDIETGNSTFSCDIHFKYERSKEAQSIIYPGNYILYYSSITNSYNAYTIIDTEFDAEGAKINVYSEGSELDLINEVAEAYKANGAYNISHYINKFVNDSGFTIGQNEIPDETRTLEWTSESTVAERLRSIASYFGVELYFSFEIEQFIIKKRYINIVKKRGEDTHIELRLGRDVSNLRVSKSIANLATALKATGSVPEGKDNPITLKGYTYDDGDYYVDYNGIMKTRKGLENWARYAAKTGSGEGYIYATYSSQAITQKALCNETLAQLKKLSNIELNCDCDIIQFPETIGLGDKVYIVDDNSEIYLQARVLKITLSEQDNLRQLTFGDYLITNSGLSDRIQQLASDFSNFAKSRKFYTWIAYADDEHGNGISLDPTDKHYVGIAVNRSKEEVDISDPSIFTWSTILPGDLDFVVGGRNLVDHSINLRDLTYQSSEDLTVEVADDSYNIIATSGEHIFTMPLYSANEKSTKHTVTVSFFVTDYEAETQPIFWIKDSKNQLLVPETTLLEGRTYKTFVYEAEDIGGGYVYTIDLYYKTFGQTKISLSMLQLENGSIPTDWRPSINDQEEAANTPIAEINGTLERLTADVENTVESLENFVTNEYLQENVVNTLENNTNEVETLKSEIQTQEDTIKNLQTLLQQSSEAIQGLINVTDQQGALLEQTSALLDINGLHISQSQTSTTSNIDSKGLTITDSLGNTIASFTNEQSLVNYLQVQQYFIVASHRLEKLQFQELSDEIAGNTIVTNGTGFFWTG